jgi:D-glycero-alpha-D-manno-heptose-7-phosphate kinase
MIVTRAPLRVSFLGGGSDLPSFYRQFGGCVISMAIDQSVYVTVNRKFDDRIRVSYSKTEEVDHPDELEHPLVRECLKYMNISKGVEITSVADVHSKGTGLGSSSTFTAALLCGLHRFLGKTISPQELAEATCKIEIQRCGDPIGKQDQYAAAFGGMNWIEFFPDETVRVQKLSLSLESIESFQKHLLFFYTGITRNASQVLRSHSKSFGEDREKIEAVQQMKALALKFRDDLEGGRFHQLGSLLHQGWKLKSGLHSDISNHEIDTWYDLALKAGASGGKLLGAGAGGFLMFYAPPERHDEIEEALRFLRRVHFRMAPDGARVVYDRRKEER